MMITFERPATLERFVAEIRNLSSIKAKPFRIKGSASESELLKLLPATKVDSNHLLYKNITIKIFDKYILIK
jgi:hypothetical protein